MGIGHAFRKVSLFVGRESRLPFSEYLVSVGMLSDVWVQSAGGVQERLGAGANAAVGGAAVEAFATVVTSYLASRNYSEQWVPQRRVVSIEAGSDEHNLGKLGLAQRPVWVVALGRFCVGVLGLDGSNELAGTHMMTATPGRL